MSINGVIQLTAAGGRIMSLFDARLKSDLLLQLAINAPRRTLRVYRLDVVGVCLFHRRGRRGLRRFHARLCLAASSVATAPNLPTSSNVLASMRALPLNFGTERISKWCRLDDIRALRLF